MNELTSLIPALAGGFAVGLLFFGSLRWVLTRLPTVRQPALFVLGSFLLRTAATVVAFYLIAAGSWQRLLAATLGFVVARMLLVRIYAPSRSIPSEAK